MKPTSRKKDWRDVIRPLVDTLKPATHVIERVAQLAVHLREPTIGGMVILAAAGVNAAKNLTEQTRISEWSTPMIISKGYIVDALLGAGARQLTAPVDVPSLTQLSLYGEVIRVGGNGSLILPEYPRDEFFEWLCQAFDRVLPAVLTIGHGAGAETYTSTPCTLSPLRSQQGPKIAEATRPLLGGGRCILLDGVPGVGKTTIAHEISRELSLGRALIFEPWVIGALKEHTEYGGDSSGEYKKIHSSVSLAQAIKLTRPGVIIVDDVDKVHISLDNLEAMRKVAKLVILTANNGAYDDVIDGAMIRPGRIDEVFSIKPERPARRAPFDNLSDDDWEKVRHWPVAFLVELEKRLLNRPDNIQLSELENRLLRGVRSGGVVHKSVSETSRID